MTFRHKRFAIVKIFGIAVALAYGSGALAAPSGLQSSSGVSSVTTAGNTTTITTTAPRSVANWQSFDISAGERVQINQPSASSAMMNRITSGNPTQIYGQLSSNGQVWLINPAGIVVGPSGTIDTAGFVASTLKITDADFLASKLNFGGDAAAKAAGKIVNNGAISATSGGSIVIVAPQIENNGVITAPGGQLILAAGHSVQILNLATPGVVVDVSADKGDLNLSQMVASGQVSLVNTGTLNASNVVSEGGRIFLRAAPKDGGVLVNTGTVKAEGAPGQGGFVDTSASFLDVNRGTIAAGSGGTWLIDPVNIDIVGTGGSTVYEGNTPTTGTNTFAPTTTTNSQIDAATISSQLASGTNVIVDTNAGANGAAGTDAGNISVQALVSSNGAGNLVLRAASNVVVDGANGGQISLTGAGNLQINAGGAVSQTAGTGALGSIVAPSVAIRAGGNVTLNLATNAFSHVAVANSGSVNLNSSTGYSIDSLTADGTTVNGISAPAAAVTLDSAGAIGSTAAVSAGTLLSNTSTGLTLTNAANDIRALGNVTSSGVIHVADHSSNGAATPLSINGTVQSTYTGTGPAIILATDNAATGTGTPGDLDLGSAGQVVANGVTTGTAIELMTAGEFHNNNTSAGALALSATGGGRWLVYSADPAAIAKGGLTSNFRQYGTSAGGSATGTGNGFVYASAAPSLTLNATNSGATSQIYGDNSGAALGVSVSVTGAIDGEDVSANYGLTGSAAYTVIPSKTLAAGSYNIGYASGLTSSYGFAMSAGSTTSYLVSQRPVVLSGSKTYDGSQSISGTQLSAAAGTTGSGTGVVNGDVLTLGGTGTLSGKDAGTEGLASAGTLTLGNANYTIDVPASGATVLRKTLTLAPVLADKTYDGTTAGSVANWGVAGLVGTETLAVSGSAAYASRNAGTNTGTVSSITAANGTLGGLASNYTLPTSASATAATGISPATLTLDAVTDTRAYNGTANSSVTPVALNLQAGDSITGPAQTFDSQHAGSRTLSVTSYTVNDGNGGANYNVTLVPVSGSITPKTVTITGVAADNKTYDTTTTATLANAGTLSGVVSGEALTLCGPTSVSFEDKNAAVGKPVIATGYAIANGTGGLASDYQLASTTATTSATISPALVTYTFGVTSYSQPQGSPAPADSVFQISLNGVLAGDSVSAGVSSPGVAGAALVPTLPPGTYPLTAKLKGPDAGNYAIATTGNTGAIGTITPTTSSPADPAPVAPSSATLQQTIVASNKTVDVAAGAVLAAAPSDPIPRVQTSELPATGTLQATDGTTVTTGEPVKHGDGSVEAHSTIKDAAGHVVATTDTTVSAPIQLANGDTMVQVTTKDEHGNTESYTSTSRGMTTKIEKAGTKAVANGPMKARKCGA